MCSSGALRPRHPWLLPQALEAGIFLGLPDLPGRQRTTLDPGAFEVDFCPPVTQDVSRLLKPAVAGWLWGYVESMKSHL